MSLQHLESEALKILTALEDINGNKGAIAAARELGDALADAIEANESRATIEA